tara:strand:+ start:1073 stop:1660 length:588 start_codon:yes stop_codon:yes gene_type:complete
MKHKFTFGDVYSTIDPDKSDTDYKNYLVEYLRTNGANGYTYRDVRIVNDGKDVEAWTDTGILHMFEIKGTSEDRPLIQTYGSELMEAIRNPYTFWFTIISKRDGICQPPLFFTIKQWLELFPLQPVSVKGTLNINGLTQEMIDVGRIPKTKRRPTTLIATEDMIIENQKLREQQLDRQQNIINENVFKFIKEDWE